MILTPEAKLPDRRREFPAVDVRAIKFSSRELGSEGWKFLLGAYGNDSLYIRQLVAIMRRHRHGLTLDLLAQEIRDADRPAKPSTAPSADPSAKPTRPVPEQREAASAKALAEKLGIDEAKVTKAFDEIRAARQADRAAELKTRLDAAVKAGTLTQAEADAVTKAIEKGVIGGR